MKKLYSLLISGVLLLLSNTSLNAQCFGGRYHNFVFPSHVLTSNVQYGSNLKTSSNGTGSNQNLLMDIYEPQGDVATNRPVVIVAHGGSFVGGSKTGTDVVPLCQDLAKLGYVAISIEYRVGMTKFPIGGPPDSTDAGAAVMRAVQDGRAAVRYLRKNAAVEGNTYRIDPNNIYFAGVSAGGFIALHVAYMDQASEFPSYVDTTGQVGLLGGIEGLSGNPGYSSDVKAIINICGALGDTTWMQPGDEPVLNLHGNADNTVPYGSAQIYLLGTYPLLVVDGSASVAARANSIGVENCFKTYYNQDHTPHVNSTVYYDTTIVLMRNFLEHQVCSASLLCNYSSAIQSIPLAINEAINNEEQLLIYPNPVNNYLTIDLSDFNEDKIKIEMYDMLGKKVKNLSSVKQNQITINRDDLPNGIYMITILSNGNLYSKKIILE